MPSELEEVIARSQFLQAELLRHVMKRKAMSAELKQHCRVGNERRLVLRIAEGLIDAHKAAKIDGNGLTLDLIEDALRHVGERLACETGDGRDFRQKRLSPHR